MNTRIWNSIDRKGLEPIKARNSKIQRFNNNLNNNI